MTEKLNKIKGWFKRNQRLTIFSVCFLLSFSFWLLIKLSNTYTYRVRLKMDYGGLPVGELLANSPPEFLSADVDAPGFSLVRSWAGPLAQIRLELYDLSRIRKNGQEMAYWVWNGNRQGAQAQMPNGVRLLQVYPDTLFFALSTGVERRVAVQLNHELELRNQYRLLGEPQVLPDSVTVFGPQLLVDSLQTIPTEWLKEKDLHETLEKKVDLVLPEGFAELQLLDDEVMVRWEISQVTEGLIQVPIGTKMVPEGYELRLFPDKLSIQFLVALKDYKKIKPSWFEAWVEYPDQLSGQKQVLPVKLKVNQPGIELIQKSPNQVEFIVRAP